MHFSIRRTVVTVLASALVMVVLPGDAPAQPFVAQPAAQQSSLVCWWDPAAPAGTLQFHGILFDFELANAINNELGPAAGPPAPAWSNMVYQFNECFGGGMIDEIFNAAFPNLTAGFVSAASASQHDECSVSLPTCAGGSGYGWPYSIAVAPAPFNSRLAFLIARFIDPFGPFLGAIPGPVLEHPQYLSNLPGANLHKLGAGGAARRAIVFVGHDKLRADYHADLRRIYLDLTGNGFAPADIQVLMGPGGANVACGGAALPYAPAKRSDLFNAIANLVPAGAVAGNEYFLWFHDHGGRWIFLAGGGGAIVPVPIGPGAVKVNNFSAESDFVGLVVSQNRVLVYVESESGGAVPMRLLLNGDEIFQGDLNPADNVFEFTQGVEAAVVLGGNSITLVNLSATDELSFSALAIGVTQVEVSIEERPFDPKEVELLLGEFGACCDLGQACNDGVLQVDCNPPFEFFLGQLCSEIGCAEVGACCLGELACLIKTDADCDDIVGAAYKGDGSVCLGDQDENGIDDVCEAGPACSSNLDCEDGDPCTTDLCDMNVCDFPAKLYGDVDGSGETDLDDLMCVMEGLSGVLDCVGVVEADLDLHPCGGDGDLNLHDLISLLDTLGGSPPCPDGCL